MVYFIGNIQKEVIKIGYTKSDVKGRLKSLQTGSHCKLYVILVIEGERDLEKYLHQQFKAYNTSGEWFNISDEIKEYVRNVPDEVVLYGLDEKRFTYIEEHYHDKEDEWELDYYLTPEGLPCMRVPEGKEHLYTPVYCRIGEQA
jgi:hypothetical protein